jgi:hypothetical protein
MDCFIRAGYSGQDLQMLSTVREFLQVTVLSDLCDLAGLFVMPWAMDLSQGPNPTTHAQYLWPRRPPTLSPSHQALWKLALLRLFCSPTRRLARPLGPWLPGSLAVALSGVPGRPSPCPPLGQPTIPSICKDPRYPTCRLPTMLRCLPTRRPGPDYLYIHPRSRSSCRIPCLTIEETILCLPASERWALHQTTHIDNGASLTTAIIRRDTTAVSDGSHKDQLGTSATILRSPGDRSAAILCVNRVPGLLSDQLAYHSELAGVLASLLMVEIVCQLHDITDGAITLGLAGEQAMKDTGDDWPLHCTHAQYDIL